VLYIYKNNCYIIPVSKKKVRLTKQNKKKDDKMIIVNNKYNKTLSNDLESKSTSELESLLAYYKKQGATARALIVDNILKSR
jgi:hypothetical protein